MHTLFMFFIGTGLSITPLIEDQLLDSAHRLGTNPVKRACLTVVREDQLARRFLDVPFVPTDLPGPPPDDLLIGCAADQKQRPSGFPGFFEVLRTAGVGRGRVKRRSPTIIEQFTVAARDTAWRIFRILYPKSNRIACFRKGGDFSHGLGHEDAFPRPRLSGRCRFSQVTFARTRGNGRDAPEAVLRPSQDIDCRRPPQEPFLAHAHGCSGRPGSGHSRRFSATCRSRAHASSSSSALASLRSGVPKPSVNQS